MIDVKVRLTVTLPGRVMMSEQECSKNPKENYNNVEIKVGFGKNTKTKTITVRKCKPATKVTNICKEAYDAMTAKSAKKDVDANYCPVWAHPKKWYNLSKEQRLRAHLKRLCEHFGGISYTYEVLED